MRLMKSTLELLVSRSGLNQDDRVSLVTFDSQVKLELPLERMDAAGRAKAGTVVRRLHEGSTTNLSGGALKAIDILDQSASSATADAKRTRAVMLFTDGLANEGIRDTTALVAAVNGALTAASTKLGGPISFCTFGFGADHNEDCLRTLATSSGPGGLYYYVGSAEDISLAFADCLGGLTSVVAQNASLSITATAGVCVSRVLGSAYTYIDGTVALGDLFAEDEKDVLVELHLPKLNGPAGPAQVLSAELRAFNVARSSPDAISVTLSVARPETTPAEQPVNTALDAQRNRIEAAEAMEMASRLADNGDIDGGRQMLEACRAKVACSASNNESLSANLVLEMDDLAVNYRSLSSYRMKGSKLSKMQARSHGMQRAMHTNVNSYAAGAKRKAAMKASWSSSLAAHNDSDSD